MSTALPDPEAIVDDLGTKRSRIPGVAAMRATTGFQRGMLVFGAVIVAIFGAIALGGSGLSLEGAHGAVRAAADPEPFRIVFALAAIGLAAALVALALMKELPLRDRAPSGDGDD